MLNSVIDKVVNCQVQQFLDRMVLANQNAKLTGQTRVFSSLPSSSYESPGNEVALLHYFTENQCRERTNLETRARNPLWRLAEALGNMTRQTAPGSQLQVREPGASSRFDFNLELERLVCK
jgi:hypothetical protein